MSGIAPSTRIYESLLNIWLKSQRADSLQGGREYFSQHGMSHSWPPFVTSFQTLMETYVRSPSPNAAEKAEEILETMAAANVQPDTSIYSLVARAWSKSWRHTAGGPVPVVADAQTGEMLRMDYRTRTTQTYRRCLEAGLQPDASMLRSLFSVYCRDRSLASLEAAEAILIDLALRTPPATLPGPRGRGRRPGSLYFTRVCFLKWQRRGKRPMRMVSCS